MPPQLDELGSRQIVTATPAAEDFVPFYDVSELGNGALKKAAISSMRDALGFGEDDVVTISSLEVQDSSGTVLVPSAVENVIYTQKSGQPVLDTASGSKAIVSPDAGVLVCNQSLFQRIDSLAVGSHSINIGSFPLTAEMLVSNSLLFLTGTISVNALYSDFTITSAKIRFRPDNGTHTAVGDGLTVSLSNVSAQEVLFLAAALQVAEDGGALLVEEADLLNGTSGATGFVGYTRVLSSGTLTAAGGAFASPSPIPWFASPADVDWLVDLTLVIAAKPGSVSPSFVSVDCNLRVNRIA